MKDQYIGARALSRALAAQRRGPITISGFFSDPRGVAQAARLSAETLEAAGLPVVRHDIGAMLVGKMPGPPPGDAGVLLLHANPPEAGPLLRTWPTRTWSNRYRIGYWVWEMPTPPAKWAAPLPWFDEIWTPSQFSANSLAQLGQRQKFRVVPHPVHAVYERPDRAGFGIAENEVAVLAAFDFRSTRARKNPEGAIEAYLSAFPTVSGKTRLVVKGLAPEGDPDGARILRDIAAKRSDITVIDRTLSEVELATLFASIDIFLSLHRAEGFGLMSAQCMAIGKPVVITGWSGVKEFADAETAAFVPFKLVDARDPSGLYNLPGAQWAEPDVNAAAGLLRELASNPSRRAALGARAAQAIARKLGGPVDPLSARSRGWIDRARG